MRKKRLLSVLLSLTMLLTYMPAMAFADDEVSAAEQDLTAAASLAQAAVSIGELHNKDQVGSSQFRPTITLPEDAAYTVTERKWVRDASGTDYPYSVYAHTNDTCYAYFTLTEKEAGTFSSSTAIADTSGEAVLQGSPVYSTGTDGRMSITAIFSVVVKPIQIDYINSVDINVTAPAAGEKVGDRRFSGDGVVSLPNANGYGFPQEYTFPALSWYRNGSDLPPEHSFIAGETYKLYIQLKTKDDGSTEFTKATTVNLTGDGKVVSKSMGTQQTWTTLTIGVEVTIAGAPEPAEDPEEPLDNIAVGSSVTGGTNGPWTIKLTAEQKYEAKTIYKQKNWDASSRIAVTLPPILSAENAVAECSESGAVCELNGKQLTVTGYDYSSHQGKALTVSIKNVEVDQDRLREKTKQETADAFASASFYIENTTYSAAFPMQKVTLEPVSAPKPVWNSTRVSWNAVSGATGYTYRIYNTNDRIQETGTTSNTSLDVSSYVNSHDAGTYYIYVAAKQGSAVSKEGSASMDFYRVTVRPSNKAGGTISGSAGFTGNNADGSISGLFANGSSVTLTATATNGYTFIGFYGFSGKAPEDTTRSPLTFTVSSNQMNIWAHFEKNGGGTPEVKTARVVLDMGDGHAALESKVSDLASTYGFEASVSGTKVIINKFPAQDQYGDNLTVSDTARQLGWLIYESLGSGRQDSGKTLMAIGLRPAKDYKSMDEVDQDLDKAEEALSDGKSFYALWAAPLKNADLTVTPLECGTKVSTSVSEYGIGSQTNAPDFKVSTANAKYKVMEDEGVKQAYWINSDKTGYMNGTANGDNSYTAYAILQPEFGYLFDLSGDSDAVTVKVNGQALDAEEFRVSMDGRLMILADIRAQHNIVTESGSTAPDCENEGTSYTAVICSGCGKEYSRQESAIPALGHDWGDWRLMDRKYHIRFCSRDGSHSEKGVHEWEFTGMADDGNPKYKCKVCGVAATGNLSEIIENGHLWLSINEELCEADKVEAVRKALEELDILRRSDNPTKEALTAAINALNDAIDAAQNQGKAANGMKVKVKKTLKAKKSKTKKFKASAAIKVSGANGKLSYRKVGKAGGKKIKVAKNGRITVKKGLKKGKTYKVKIRVTAAGNSKYKAASKVVTVKIRVK